MFKLISDSREQRALAFKEGVFDAISVECLPFGDYSASIDGKVLPFTFERKAIGDLFGSFTKGYKREKVKIEKAKKAGHIYVLIIEGSLKDVYKGYKYSKCPGKSMVKRLFTIFVKHGVIFCEDRRTMARYIEETFYAIRENYKKDVRKKTAKKKGN